MILRPGASRRPVLFWAPADTGAPAPAEGAGVVSGIGGLVGAGYELPAGSGVVTGIGGLVGEGSAPAAAAAEGSGVVGGVGSLVGVAASSQSGAGGPEEEIFDAPYRAAIKRREKERKDREAKKAEPRAVEPAAAKVEPDSVVAAAAPLVGLMRAPAPRPMPKVKSPEEVRAEVLLRQERDMRDIMVALLDAA